MIDKNIYLYQCCFYKGISVQIYIKIYIEISFNYISVRVKFVYVIDIMGYVYFGFEQLKKG